MDKQAKIWADLSNNIDMQALEKAYKNPALFQKELAQYIDGLFKDNNNVSSLELGASYGITSAILSDKFNKTILDLDENALLKAREFYKRSSINIKCICADIFDFKSEDKYDVVFNAGLLEHFNFEQRCIIINKMVGIVKPSGYIIVGVPNHSSLPYSLSYFLLNALGKWKYPKEKTIYSLKREFKYFNNVKMLEVVFFDNKSQFYYLTGILKYVFIILSKKIRFQPYLKTFVYQKIK